MITINIDIDGQETTVNLEKSISEINATIWSANESDIRLTIEEINGRPVEGSLFCSENVSSPKSVVYDRFMQSFNMYTDEISSGFEPTENIENSNSEPQPYNPDEIKVRREGFSVFEINRMMTTQDDIDLNPAFQRNLVWDNSRKSALIESILLGIPIPVFYFAESKSGRYYVVDGMQRLSTLKQFLNNEFPLKKLEHLGSECNGRYYSRDEGNPNIKDRFLERKYSRRLENAQLFVNVIESASPQKVKYDIFKRINTGGRPLNYQEIRNCVSTDAVRAFLKSSASSESFLSATGESVSDTRMEAQELILRFVGFCLQKEGRITYSGDMNSFLNEVVDIINDFSISQLDDYKRLLFKGLDINFHLFGSYCFRKCLPQHLSTGARKQSINKALFITWMMEVLKLDQQWVENNVDFGTFAITLADELETNSRYLQIVTTGTSDTNNLKTAMLFAGQLIDEHLRP